MADFSYTGGAATGFTGFANLFASVIGNVTGYSGVAAPPAPTGSNGFIQAMCDGILQAVGHQTSNYAAYVSTGTSSTSFVDVPGSEFSWTPPASKTYVFEVDHQFFRSAGSGNANFRIVVGAVNGETWVLTPATNNAVYGPLHHGASVFLTGGSPVTAKLQWLAAAGNAFSVNSDCARKWFVRG